jgi:hypothetical protein
MTDVKLREFLIASMDLLRRAEEGNGHEIAAVLSITDTYKDAKAIGFKVSCLHTRVDNAGDLKASTFDTYEAAARALFDAVLAEVFHQCQMALNTKPDEQAWMHEPTSYWHELQGDAKMLLRRIAAGLEEE